VRLTKAGEIDRQRIIDETVGRPYDLLRRLGLGDLNMNINIVSDINNSSPHFSSLANSVYWDV